jgi:hypothetical protein
VRPGRASGTSTLGGGSPIPDRGTCKWFGLRHRS